MGFQSEVVRGKKLDDHLIVFCFGETVTVYGCEQTEKRAVWLMNAEWKYL